MIAPQGRSDDVVAEKVNSIPLDRRSTRQLQAVAINAHIVIMLFR